jgi:hypothetical protein
VAHGSGDTAGAAFTGTLTINNGGALDGAKDVSWNVYASLGDTTIDAADKLVATGTIVGGLPAGGSSGALAISSSWPTVPGSYYLLAEIFATDDANTANNRPAPASVIVGAVDYSGSVSFGAGATANRPFNGTLTITNGGNRNGAAAVSCTVYASLGNTTIDAADKVVYSGTIAGGLPASGGSGPIPIGNTWPTTPGTYYLVAELQAADDYLTANNRFATGAIVVNPPNVDYTAPNITYSAAAPSTTTPGGIVEGSFQYQNVGTAAGIQPVFWTAYASLNTTLDASDTWIASGSGGPLAAGALSGVVNFSGAWPLDYGKYYLIVMVSEIEDVNSLNDRMASAATTSVGIYDESLHEPNNDYSGLSNAYDLGVTFKPGMSILINGTMSSSDMDDVTTFNTGTSSKITIAVYWNTGKANIRIFVYAGPPPATFVTGVSGTTDAISLNWQHGTPNVVRYLDLDNYGANPPLNGPYQCVISAD